MQENEKSAAILRENARWIPGGVVSLNRKSDPNMFVPGSTTLNSLSNDPTLMRLRCREAFATDGMVDIISLKAPKGRG